MSLLTQKAITQGSARVRSVGRSHVGLMRALNEDRVFDCPEAGLWAVADGMGGHRGGDIAAQMAIDALRDLVARTSSPSFAQAVDALHCANLDIVRRNKRDRFESGTTIVLALLDGADLHIAWAGDSRAYRLRDAIMTQLTRDHSLVQELMDAGLLTPEGARRHPQANVVTRALGVSDDVAIETLTLEFQSEDALLLCSDGLSRSFQSHSLARIADIEASADALVAKALADDGSDNISLVLVTGSGSSSIN